MNERIKQIRKALGLSQDEFAASLGYTRGKITNIESGKTVPTADDPFINLMCRIHNVNPVFVETGKGDMFIPLTRNQEILAFANQVMADEDEAFRKRFVHALSESSPAFWEELEKIVARTLKKD